MYGVREVKATREEYEVAKANGISPRTVRYRIQKGYTTEQAITIPVYKRRTRK